jgi:hypothetical protein
MIEHEVIIQRITEVYWAGRWVVSCYDGDIRFADAAWLPDWNTARPVSVEGLRTVQH